MGVSLTYQGLKHGDHRLQKVMIDKIRVQQILINLIQNAIKFSRSGDKVQVKSKDETSKRMNQGSHGLGLNICKQFA